MEKIISPEEAQELMGLKGEARGISIKGEGDFILKEEGEEGLKKLENALKEAGYPLNYKEIKTMDFYPIGMEALMLVAAKRLFGYDDKKFQEMGRFEPKVSFLIRMFLKHLVSSEAAIKKASEIWRKNYTVGTLKIEKFDAEEKEAVVRILDFRLHPLQCHNLIGYFSSIAQMITGSPAQGKETKCIFRGDDYHEFVINW